jgi:hypothetical protein
MTKMANYRMKEQGLDVSGHKEQHDTKNSMTQIGGKAATKPFSLAAKQSLAANTTRLAFSDWASKG